MIRKIIYKYKLKKAKKEGKTMDFNLDDTQRVPIVKKRSELLEEIAEEDEE